MIFERCASIIIYVSFSSLNLSSAIAASIVPDSHAIRDEITLDRQTIDSASKAVTTDKLKQTHFNPESSLKLAQRENLEPDSTTPPNLPVSESLQTAIDRYWALGAIALTSSISLFLLWLLFRTPQNKEIVREIVTEQTIPGEKQTSITKPDSAINSSAIHASLSPAGDSPSEAVSSSLDSTIAHIDVVQELIQDLQAGKSADDTISSHEFDADLQISRRRKAIWELTKTGDYRSIEPLLRIMPTASATDKSLIAEAVSQITSRSFQPINEQLFANLQDPNPEVRLNAVRDLKHLYQFVTPAIAKIASMQSDPDYQVRQTAIQTLRQLNVNPLPTFSKSVAKNSASEEINRLVSGEDSEANLHLVAYLLAELDTEK